jgi:hypothetical protein
MEWYPADEDDEEREKEKKAKEAEETYTGELESFGSFRKVLMVQR